MSRPIPQREYEFESEESFQAVLARTEEFAKIHDQVVQHLKEGFFRGLARVPGQPDRVLVLRERLELLLGQQLVGNDLVSLPVDL